MSRFALLTAAALFTVTGGVSASSFIATTDTLGKALANSSEWTTDLTFGDDDNKVLLAAREDAASFVASEGRIRGARLEAALQQIRRRAPHLQADDMQLTEAILAL